MGKIAEARRQARLEGKTRFFTGTPCVRGHIAERTASNGACTKCNSEAQLARQKRGDVKHQREATRRWKANNPEKRREGQNDWHERNRGKSRKYNNDRRARVQAPAWADQEAIARVYAFARLAEVVTGLPHHVDHIIPLKGATVSGLHVENNLQVMLADDNMKKGNRYEQTG